MRRERARLYRAIVAQALVDAAERTCPYSKAIRGNVPFSITLV